MSKQRDPREAANTGQGEENSALYWIGEPNDPRLWVQIANGIIRDINAGKITPGKPLPSKDELADRYGSSVGPPQRAYQELIELGLIHCVPGLRHYLVTKKLPSVSTAHDVKVDGLPSVSVERRASAAGLAKPMHGECPVLPRPNPAAAAEKRQADSRVYASTKGRPAMKHSLSARHTLVGGLLRQYRESLGYSLDEAARILDCDRSKISRIETGKRGIRSLELRALLTEYGVDATTQSTLVALIRPSRGTDGWWRDYRQVLGDGYLDFTIAEGAAAHVLVYAPLHIPDLLRTEAYAKAVAEADPAISEDAENLAVEAVMARQETVLSKRRADCNVVLGETALKQQLGGVDVLDKQLAHLADLATRYPWLTIRILPFTTGEHAAAADSGGFSVLQFRATPDLGLVHLSGPAGGMCLDDTAAVGSYAKVFTHLSCLSLSPEQSVMKLRQLATR